MFINIRITLRLLAMLSIISCIFMLPCVITSFYLGEMEALKGFGISYLFIIPSSLILIALKKPDNTRLGIRDGFLLVLTSWLSLAAHASIPFYFSDAVTSIAGAFFEGASAVTTTGASVISDVESLELSILLWRSVCLWMGGMGIIMLTVAILPLLGIGGLQLVKAEQQVLDSDKVTSRVTTMAKALWIIYVCFTVLFIVLYKIGGLSTFDAVNHAFSSIASGGFSIYNGGVGYYSSAYVQWVTIGAMFVTGVSFFLYYKLFTGRVVSFFKNSELRAYIFIILTAAAVVSWVNYHSGIYNNAEETLRYSFFHVVSLATSTGFATADYNQWPSLCKAILFTLMFVGGCAGSTAGGFKVVRMVILFKQAVNEMKRLVHPRGVFLIRLNGQVLDKNVVFSVSGFFFLYVLSVVIVSLVASSAGTDIITAISTGFAIVGNTGVGFQGIGPLDTYAFYPEYVKWVLSVAMIVGRVELYAFFLLFMPFFWRRT